MRVRIFLISIGLGLLAAPVTAQLGLPQVRTPQTGTVLDPVTGQVLDPVQEVGRGIAREAQRLLDLRNARIDRLVRRNRDKIELDAQGEPARRGEILVLDANQAAIEAATRAGYRVLDSERIEGLDLAVIRLALPDGRKLADAEAELVTLMPGVTISADNLYFASGTGAAPLSAMVQAAAGPIATPVGVIDGGVGPAQKVLATRGFAQGAPMPSNHGSAVVSLLDHVGARNIRVADVYGADPAGGNALAIARAFGWLVTQGSRVVNVSLVGPPNAVVERAVASAQAKGVVVVAAVGNDGPAAPPAYPASYEDVVAVTAVDGRNRALIEAGRALHLDYAAPGANLRGPNATGKKVSLRGTSFASPLVAARLAAALDGGNNWRRQLDREAKDLGKPGPDASYGRGLVCDSCRPR